MPVPSTCMLVLPTRDVKEPRQYAGGTAGDATEDRSPGLEPRERVVPKAITRRGVGDCFRGGGIVRFGPRGRSLGREAVGEC